MKPMGSVHMIALAKKHDLLKRNGISAGRAMLRHVLGNDIVHAAIPAMNSMTELADNLEAAFNPALSDDELALLDTISRKAAATKRTYLPRHYTWLEDWSSAST